MESDSVRTIGDSTLVDMWLSGQVRSISVSREAIAEFKGLHAGQANALSDEDRSEFVRTHLTLIATAAAARLRDDPATEQVTIETGQLRREDAARAPAERRQGDRRKGDRRKRNVGPPTGVERRRS
jgi:hypothetical protein